MKCALFSASKLFTERKGRTGLIFNIALSLTSIQRRNLNPLKKIDHSIGKTVVDKTDIADAVLQYFKL